jgi:hypothetical protein
MFMSLGNMRFVRIIFKYSGSAAEICLCGFVRKTCPLMMFG